MDEMQERGYGAGAAKVTGAVIAGVLAATLSHPADTIKTCMQVCICGDVDRKRASQRNRPSKCRKREKRFKCSVGLM